MKIIFIQTGGTIDKDYPQNATNHGYEFEIAEPAFDSILKRAKPDFEYEVLSVLKKDSLDITDEDRQKIFDTVNGVSENKIVITHGTDTIHVTAKKLSEIIDPNIIRYSSISEQGKTAQILFDTPANRLKKLKEILGIDKLADLSEEIKKEIQDKEQTIKELNNEVKFLEEIKYNYRDRPDLPNIEEVKTKFELLEKDKQLYESQNKLYEKYLQEEQVYINAQDTIYKNESSICDSKSKIDELNKSQIEYNHTESEDELREQLSNYEKAKVEQDYKVDNYQKIQLRATQLERSIEDQKKELEKYQIRRIHSSKWTEKDLKDTEEVNNQLKIELPQLEKELNLVEQGKCPTCGKDYVIENTEELIKKIEDYRIAIKCNNEFIVNYNNDLKLYNNAVNEQELIKVKRQAIQDKIDTCTKELESLSELEFDEESLNNLCDYISLIKEIKDKLENRKQVQFHNIQI